MNKVFSSIWLELGFKNQKKILVSNVYRDWQHLDQIDHSSRLKAAQLDRWHSYINQWEAAIKEDKEIICMGDMNINFLNWTNYSQPSDSDDFSSLLLEKIVPHGFLQLVSQPTRFWPGQNPSGLDHFFSNRPNKIMDLRTSFIGCSDHKMLLATRTSKSVVSRTRIIKKRIYKNFNPNIFLEAIQKEKWWDIYSSNDLNFCVQLFTNKINNILNIMAPIKKVQNRAKYASYISESTKEMIRKCNFSFQQASLSGNLEDWNNFKAIRNKVTNTLRKEKLNWQKSKMDNTLNNNSSIWKHLKSFLGWNTGGPPSKLIYGGKVYSKPRELSNIMNSYFVSKIAKLIENIPRNGDDPLKKIKHIFKNKESKFHLRSVHPEEVLSVIGNLKSSKSCGLDNIDSYIIKLARFELTPTITHIVNLAFRQGSFPSLWKCAKVVPLLKKGDPTETKNYRPVALLSVTSKIMERLVFDQMISYLESNNILHPSHHGFRAKHNTCTALLQMQDLWLDALERKEISAVVMCDMSSAFDVVNHELLLGKLELFGFQRNILDWLRSYLSERKQRVVIDGFLSDPLDIQAGVPQGSILGPLLYICFTNDMPESIHDHDIVPCNQGIPFDVSCQECGSVCCFADDSTFSKSNKDAQILKNDIDSKYKSIINYMNTNLLVMNTDKTKLLVMDSKVKHRWHNNHGITLNTGSEVIMPEYCGKMLGGVISCDFSWNFHIKDDENSMFRQVITRVNALNKIARCSSFKTRKFIANGIVISKLTYLIQLWGGCSKYLIMCLQLIQNRAARIVTGKDWSTSVETLLLQCGWLSMNQLIAYHSLVLVYKIRTERKPHYFCERFNTEFSRETRLATSDGIRVMQKNRLSLTKSGFRVRASADWNLLPQDVRRSKDILCFKRSVRAWTIKNIPLYP